MKKMWLFIFIIIPFGVKALSASSYIVMDQDSGRVLEGVNINDKHLIASITKIMTCIVALEHGDIDKTVKVNDDILKAYGSGIYIQVGEELTLDDLLYGLMLRSGNDAALAIASAVAGNKESFVYWMNETAQKIGMKNTTFVNPSGLEESDGSANKSTTYDMALLTKYAMQNEYYRKIVSTKDIVVKSSYKTYKWFNKNKLLRNYEYCTGGKTGYTEKAHRTLVTTASKDGMNLIVVTFNDGNDFNDHKKLYEKYFSTWERKLILNKDDDYGKDVFLGNDFYLVSKKDDIVTTKVIKEVKKDSLNGSIVGKVEVYINNKLIGYRYLYFRKASVTKNKSFLDKLSEFLKFWERI